MDSDNQIINQGEDSETLIEVKFISDAVWLSQQRIVDLYQTLRSNVVEHIKRIYEYAELTKDSICKNFRSTCPGQLYFIMNITNNEYETSRKTKNSIFPRLLR